MKQQRQKQIRIVARAKGSIQGMLWKCIAIMLVLSCATATAQEKNDSLDMAIADSLFDKGDYAGAITTYTRLITANNNPEYFYFRGNTYKELRDYKKSLADYSKAIELAPDSSKYVTVKAEELIAIHNLDEAANCYTQAIKAAKPDSIKRAFTAARGAVYYTKKDYRSAEADLARVLAAEPSNYIALVTLASVYDETHRDSLTRKTLEKAAYYYPEDVPVLSNLAYVYLNLGDYKQALSVNDKVIELSGGRLAIPFNNRGYVKYMLKDNDGALKDINASLELDPSNAYAYRNRALVLLSLGKAEMACPDLEQALRLGFTASYGNEVEDLSAQNCK